MKLSLIVMMFLLTTCSGGIQPVADAGSDAAVCVDAGAACSPCCTAGEVCWDYRAHDSLCAGTVCSIPCTRLADCITYATRRHASQPDNAVCGDDHLCDLVSTGLGHFVCAAMQGR